MRRSACQRELPEAVQPHPGQQQAERPETAAAVALGQRYKARVRQLEQLVSACRRERDEDRNECLLLREKLARSAAKDKPVQRQLQLQNEELLRGGTSAPSAGSSRNVDGNTPALHLELHAKDTEDLGAIVEWHQQQKGHVQGNLLQPKDEHHQQLQQNQQLQQQQQKQQEQVTPLQQQAESGLHEVDRSLSIDSGVTLQPSPTWTNEHSFVQFQEPSPTTIDVAAAQLPQGGHLGPSLEYSCSNFQLPSFSSTTPPVLSSCGGLANLPGGGHREGGLSPGAESVCSSSRQWYLPEPPEADVRVMLNSLPKRGQLLQAVKQAGPLLQTLMLAGSSPQWRRPPPAVACLEIPKVALPSGGPMIKAKGTGSLNTKKA